MVGLDFPVGMELYGNNKNYLFSFSGVIYTYNHPISRHQYLLNLIFGEDDAGEEL